MTNEAFILALLALCGVALFLGLASGVCAMLDIMEHRKADPVATTINVAEGFLYGTGITLPMFMETREEARSAILAAADQCSRMEHAYLLFEAGCTGARPDAATAIAMRAEAPLRKLARDL